MDNSKASFLTNQFRYVEATDSDTRTKYPNSTVVELDTYTDKSAATSLANTILNATKTAGLAFNVEIDGIVGLNDLNVTAPHYILDFPSYATDGRTYKIIGLEADYVKDTTTITVRG